MCLLFIAWKSHPSYRLILAANRDEFYDRPTSPAHFWRESPDILGGRDLQAGGTWLGVTTRGRIAAITNYRDPASIKSQAPSRGKLVTDFLSGTYSPGDYQDHLSQNGDQYNGFNLVFGNTEQLAWHSNHGGGGRHLEPGIYGLSNHLLDTPWPKVNKGKEAFKKILSPGNNPAPSTLFKMLTDRSPADDISLPDTGVGSQWERVLSPIFITSPTYGTRSSTLIYIDLHGHVTFMERTYNSNPNHFTTVKFEFQIEPKQIA